MGWSRGADLKHAADALANAVSDELLSLIME
jgi:hypothetical protein